MKIILFSRRGVECVSEEMHLIFSQIGKYGFDYAINKEFAKLIESRCGISVDQSRVYHSEVGDVPRDSIMVCYGGDGTLLEGVHRLGGAEVPVVGINSGRLGFLTSVAKNEIEQLFGDIAAANLRVERRSMLRIGGQCSALAHGMSAVNEVAVQRQGGGMIAVDVFIDGQAVATYNGDGVIIATPTGSTAYSLSVGGAILSPQCRCFSLSPIAPHNLTMRPIVIPETSRITLRVRTRQDAAQLSLDNLTFGIENGAEVEISRSDNELLLVVGRNKSFYDTLRDKMMWGVDKRE